MKKNQNKPCLYEVVLNDNGMWAVRKVDELFIIFEALQKQDAITFAQNMTENQASQVAVKDEGNKGFNLEKDKESGTWDQKPLPPDAPRQ